MSSKAEPQTCISDFVPMLSSVSCGVSRGLLGVALGPGKCGQLGVVSRRRRGSGAGAGPGSAVF